jgi:hypothetical protein
MHTKFYSEKLKKRDHMDDIKVYGRILLKRVLVRYRVGKCGLD